MNSTTMRLHYWKTVFISAHSFRFASKCQQPTEWGILYFRHSWNADVTQLIKRHQYDCFGGFFMSTVHCTIAIYAYTNTLGSALIISAAQTHALRTLGGHRICNYASNSQHTKLNEKTHRRIEKWKRSTVKNEKSAVIRTE